MSKPTPLIRTPRWLRVIEWSAVGLGGLLLIGGGLGLWALRTGRAAKLVEGRLIETLRDRCGLEARFASFEIEPIGASMKVRGLRVSTSTGRAVLALNEGYLDISILPLFRGQIEINKILIDEPAVDLPIKKGKLAVPCVDRGGEPPQRPPPVHIKELGLVGGRLTLRAEDARLDLSGITVGLWPGSSGGSEVEVGIQKGALVPTSTTGPLQRQVRLGGSRLLAHVEGPLVAPRAIRLLGLQSDVAGFGVDANGSVDLLGPVYDLTARLSGRLEELGDLLPSVPTLGGAVQLEGTIRGRALAPRVTARLEVKEGVVGHRDLGKRVRLRAVANRERVLLKEVFVDLDPGRVQATGFVDLDERLTTEIKATTEGLSFARLMDAIGEPSFWVDFRATGPVELKGGLRPVRLEGPFRFGLSGVDVWEGPWDDRTVTEDPTTRLLDVVPLSIEGRWLFTDAALNITRARLESDRSQGSAKALIRHKAPGMVRVQADFERMDFSDLGDVAGITLQGAGPLSARLQGLFENLSAAGTMDLEGIAIGDIPLGGATAEVYWDGDRALSFDGLEGRIGATRWHGGVYIRFVGPVPVRVTGEIGRGRLGDLLLPLGFDPSTAANLDGRIRGRFSLRGPVSQWRGRVRLEGDDVSAAGQSLGNAQANARLIDGRVQVDSLVLERGQGRVLAQGWLDPPTTEFQLKTQTEGLSLSDIDALREAVPELGGLLRSESQLSGTLSRPRGVVKVQLSGIRAGSQRVGDGSISLDFDGNQAGISAEVAGAGMALDGRIRLKPVLPYEATITLNKAPAPAVLGALLNAPISGRSTLKAQLNGKLVELVRSSGDIRLDHLRAVIGGTALDVSASEPLRLERGVLALDGVRILTDGLRLEAGGRLGPGVIDVGLDGRMDLRLLSQWVPAIERAAGRFQFLGRLKRDKSGLGLIGAGNIADGALEWRGIPNRISGIRSELTFSQSSVIVDQASARWAGGTVEVGGSMLLDQLIPRGMGFRVGVRAVRPTLPLAWMDLTARLDGSLELTGTWPKLSAKGKFGVREGRATPRTDVSEYVGSRQLAVAYDPSAEVLEMDLGLELLDRFRVKNDDLDVALTGALRLMGTNERPGLLGTLALERGGRVSFVGREYITEGGIIELRDRYRISTSYDLSLSTTACNARILLGLVGDLETVNTTYTSNPEMDREDISSCLVRGVKRRDLDQDLASFAGSALLKLSGVDRQVKRVIPIDQIDVTTEWSSLSRAYEPRVLVAKDLSLLDRPVRLEYSTSLLRNDDQRAAFRVRLTPRLSLQLGWTSSEDVPMGDWGLDLTRRWQW